MPRKNRAMRYDDEQAAYWLANLKREIYALQKERKEAMTNGKQEVPAAPGDHRAR